MGHILQQLATLSPPFIDHCEKLMDFSREVARKYLTRYMFEKTEPKTTQSKMVEHVLKSLSTVNLFKVHGRMIDGNAAKTDLKLNVQLLGKDDSLWTDLWHYYVRADVLLSKRGGVSKLVETKDEALMRQSS